MGKRRMGRAAAEADRAMATRGQQAGTRESPLAALQASIDRCRVDPDAPVPPIVEIVQDAYHVAQRWRYLSFALREGPNVPTE
jgi:hypothetical protein